MHNEDYKDIVCWGENGETIMIVKVCFLLIVAYCRLTNFLEKSFRTILSMATFLPLSDS